MIARLDGQVAIEGIAAFDAGRRRRAVIEEFDIVLPEFGIEARLTELGFDIPR